MDRVGEVTLLYGRSELVVTRDGMLREEEGVQPENINNWSYSTDTVRDIKCTVRHTGSDSV